MIVCKQDFFKASYCALIAVTILSPERFGTTLKYGIIPLILMVLFSNIKTCFSVIRGLTILFLIAIVESTSFSTCKEVNIASANFRSLCILIILFVILSDIALDVKDLESIKSFYIICTLFCGIWIVGTVFLHGLASVNRYEFNFIWGLKDVNYLLAFMLPGCYLAVRRLIFERERNKLINILCVFTVFLSILFLETRASFITVIFVSGLLYLEYISTDGLNIKKVLVTIFLVVVATSIVLWIFSNPAFSRLTSVESYEDNIRLTIWEESLKGYLGNKLFGGGLGAASYYSTVATGYQSHNNYIDILCDFGLVGSCLFIVILIAILNVPRNKKLHMIAYMVSAMLPLAFINGFQTLVFWVPMLLLVHENIILVNGESNNDRNINGSF